MLILLVMIAFFSRRFYRGSVQLQLAMHRHRLSRGLGAMSVRDV